MTRVSLITRGSWALCTLLMAGVCAVDASRAMDEVPPRERIGVLVIAHGGTERWNGQIHHAVKNAHVMHPTEVALGMGMHPEEVRLLQHAVDRLERRAIARIIVVPLFISSSSEVYRQFEYLFGQRQEASWPEAGHPLRLTVPVVIGHALDDHPVVSAIVLKRAKRLSRRPAEETVVLIAHGPNDDADNARWMETMLRLVAIVKREGTFHDVIPLTMRDDAASVVRDQATAQLRTTVQRVVAEGRRALIIPLLLAQGGIERKIPQRLAGLTYVYSGETLLPDPKVAQWIAAQVEELSSATGNGR